MTVLFYGYIFTFCAMDDSSKIRYRDSNFLERDCVQGLTCSVQGFFGLACAVRVRRDSRMLETPLPYTARRSLYTQHSAIYPFYRP